MIIASLILGFSIIIASIIIIYPNFERNGAAMSCLKDLVDSINKEFPGSTLTITTTKDAITVSGNIKKYVINEQNN